MLRDLYNLPHYCKSSRRLNGCDVTFLRMIELNYLLALRSHVYPKLHFMKLESPGPR
jgi:hypothetical protein